MKLLLFIDDGIADKAPAYHQAEDDVQILSPSDYDKYCTLWGSAYPLDQ